MINNIKNTFYWLAKTDINLIDGCTNIAKKNQISLGIMVMLTALMAFLSSSFFMFTFFNNLIVSILIALLYSFIILMIDREIVGTSTKSSAIIRFFLALVIGLLVSIPLEMKIFEGSILTELDKRNKIENKDAFQRVKKAQDNYEIRKNTIVEDIRKQRAIISEYSNNMESEAVGRIKIGRTGIAGIGPAYNESKRAKEEAELSLIQLKKELDNLDLDNKKDQENVNTIFEKEKINLSDDFLSRYEALERVKDESWSCMSIAWLIRILFILIEVTPALTKILKKDDEYNYALQARTTLNAQCINVKSNQIIEQLQNNDNYTVTPKSSTDWIKGVVFINDNHIAPAEN